MPICFLTPWEAVRKMSVLHDEILAAIGAHGTWKSRLASAVATGKSEFAAQTVRMDNQCQFGKWLYSISDPAVKNSPYYRKCQELHREFHQVAARILELALEKKKDEATRALEPNSEYAKLSGRLTISLMEWSQTVPSKRG